MQRQASGGVPKHYGITVRNLKKSLAEQGAKLTFLPYVVKSTCFCIEKIPSIDTSFNEEAGEIMHKHYWNIGIAADTDRGLLVPVVKHAGP